ncbi:MAG: patatin-like phospholipase family protein [Aquificae bacterium]|nr:patatin-like phospholipase family protein [Aquificota bacterium]
MNRKIGIVLSGGAVRAFAHIGVLKALEEKGIVPDFVSGTSAGAIVGAFYCAGYSPDELYNIANNIDFLSHIRPNIFPKKSLFKIVNFEKTLKRFIKADNIQDLEKPLFVGVSNISDGTVEYWDRGNISSVLTASSSLPFFFEPVEIDGKLYVDGGLMNNLPVEPLIDKCDYIIGVEVNPFWKERNLNNIISITIRSFYLAVRSNIEVRKKYCSLFIQPENLSKIGLFELWKWKEAVEIGYRCTKEIQFKV